MNTPKSKTKAPRMTWAQAMAQATAEQHAKRLARLEKKAVRGFVIVKTNADMNLLLKTGRWGNPQKVVRLMGAGQTWMLAQIIE